MFGIPVITTICHQFESFISETHKRFDAKAATSALAFVDLLRKTIHPKGRDTAGVTAIEQALEHLRTDSLHGRASVLLVEPSEAVRKLYQDVFAGKPIQWVMMEKGLTTLERMLHEPFDLLVISRELPDLNAIAVVAALRESRSRNSNIPVILVSSNPAPVPKHLGVAAIVKRNPQMMPTLLERVVETLAQPRAATRAP